MHYYALTLRPLKTMSTQEKLDMIDAEIQYLNTEVYSYPKTKFFINYEVEYKKNGNHNVHAHCTLQSERKIYIDKIIKHDNGPKKDWSFCLKSINEPVGWEAYRMKRGMRCHQDVHQQILDIENHKKDIRVKKKMSPTERVRQRRLV